MEILSKAYNITSKYGISLYNFGPFLSYVNNKIGICLDIKDEKYNYLTRNFSFDNLNDFENFIKKYAYYKNTLKGNSVLALRDYKCVSPKINYDFEKEEELKILNDQKEAKTIIKESESLYFYVENLYNKRIDQLILRDKARMAMNDKLSEYKRSLHNFYGKEYQEELNSILDETINKYQSKVKNNLKSLRILLDNLKNKSALKEVKEAFKNIVLVIKDFEIDKEYLSLLYDLYLFKNKVYVIETMNEHLIQELNREVKITPQELKKELENIKNSIVFNNTKENFINESIKDIEEKYDAIISIEEYNIANFLNNNDFIKLDVVEKTENNSKNIKNDYMTQYNYLEIDEKNCLLILFSPFRKIINYILQVSKNNNPESISFDKFKDFYQDILEKLGMIDNLIFKEKYFGDIDFTDFDAFISSLKIIAEKLYKISFVANVEEKYWAYHQEDSLIFASREVIKSFDNSILCILVKPGSNVLYSKQKVKIINDKFIVEDNSDIFILNDLNKLQKLDYNEEVKNYKPIIKKETVNGKTLDIVIDIKEIGTYKYDNYILEAKNNE